MVIRSLIRLGALALLIGLGALAVHARQNEKEAASAPLSGGAIAVVDMDRLYIASGGREALAQKMMELGQDIQERINAFAATPYLTRQERLEYLDLLSKRTLSDAEQTHLKALKALSDQRTDELQALTVKKDLSPAEKARQQELIDQRHALEQALPDVREVARAQQEERVADFRQGQLQRLRAAVAEVARQKGIAHVFDASALVYSANDLTPLVLQRLDKHAGK
ncbi:MAG TPA: OmpH family outer membrane protein [Chthonomonadaceae bacterium]|nr:OmpH family outer membrane protein [Chthonomonadaceae bacterium]